MVANTIKPPEGVGIVCTALTQLDRYEALHEVQHFEHNPLNPLTRFIVRRCPLDADAHLLGAGQARRLVCGAGFTSVAARYYLFLPQGL